jgi:hypothetical protein
MKIWFFEEFPDSLSFKNLGLIDFDCGLVLADYSTEGYNVLKKEVKNKYVKDFMYWPIINKKDGYWFNRFSKRKAMLRSMDEMLDFKEKIMLDLELPVLNKKLFFTEFFKSFKNKKYLKLFIEKKEDQIYTGEYFYEMPFSKILSLRFKGEHKIIKMMYSSMMGVKRYARVNRLKFLKKEFGDRLCIGLGVIGSGVLNNEKQLSVELLERDLEDCQRVGIKEVFIFRLGGLNKKYVKIIKKFI